MYTFDKKKVRLWCVMTSCNVIIWLSPFVFLTELLWNVSTLYLKKLCYGKCFVRFHFRCMMHACVQAMRCFSKVSLISVFIFTTIIYFFLGPCHSCLLTEPWRMHCLRFVILPSTTNVGGMEHHLYSQVLYCPCLHLLPFLKDNFFIW